MKLLVFGASNSKNSINQKLALYASSLIENTEIVEIDLNNFEAPIYSIDREKESGIPKVIQDFTSLIEEVDGLIISMAEHNGAYTVAFKNILDWSSRHDISFFKNKPMLLMATSPGGYGGKNVLGLAEKRLPKFKANIVSTFSLPSFNENFEDGKGILNESINHELNEVISSFEEALN
jgi:NAD(P)H-dependent FMN reductase